MVKLFLAGDVMIGRGIDQILRHRVDPIIFESYVTSATDYVVLAERSSGPIPRQVADDYVWGDVLTELERATPEFRIVNLETAVTARGTPWPAKGISYRMHPQNIGVLGAARVDVCSLANNHVLDWSYPGLEDTLVALERADIRGVGAGRDETSAGAPVVLTTSGATVRVVAAGSPTSGIPPAWQATADQAGIALLPELTTDAADSLASRAVEDRGNRGIAIVSIHWGPNWGHDIPSAQTRFARRLIDAGVDIVHGHSSHHPKAIEVYRGRPIFYGCGDLINDYEGIKGHREYRGDLGLMYIVAFGHGGLEAIEMTPMRMHRFRAERVTGPDADWLAHTLDRHSRRLGTRVQVTSGRRLAAVW